MWKTTTDYLKNGAEIETLNIHFHKLDAFIFILSHDLTGKLSKWFWGYPSYQVIIYILLWNPIKGLNVWACWKNLDFNSL